MNDLEKLISNLSTYWDITPAQVVDRLNFMNESEINKVVDKMKQKFKNGGVIDCLRKGGSIKDCGCGGRVEKNQGGGVTGGNWDDYHTIINAPGDTLRFKQYFSGPVKMQTHPEGGVTYEKTTRDGTKYMYGSGYRPNWWERNVLDMVPVDRETVENWQQLIKNHRNDPAVKDKTQKKEEGGNLEQNPRASRRDAIRAAMDELNMSRSQARRAYRNMKTGFRNAGLSGNELRQRARYGIIDSAYPRAYEPTAPQLPVLDDIVIEDEPIVTEDVSMDLTPNVPQVSQLPTYSSFSDRFAAARKAGLSTFKWKGKDYNTKYREEITPPAVETMNQLAKHFLYKK